MPSALGKAQAGIRRDHRATRALGVCLGAGFLGLGLYATIGGAQWPDPVAAHRALGLGLTLMLAGAGAIGISLTVTDPSLVW